MLNIHQLNDNDLISKIKSLVREENRITQEILDYLRQIESRRLFAARGFSSLFEFCVKELGYSESSAQRRISAMRLIKNIPEAKHKLESGQVNLSTLSQLQSFIRKEEAIKETKFNEEEKLDLLMAIENKSQRDCQREFAKISPETKLVKESQRPLNESLTEMKFIATSELLAKLEELKNLTAHKNKTHSMSELIEISVDLALSKLVPKGTSAAAVKDSKDKHSRLKEMPTSKEKLREELRKESKEEPKELKKEKSVKRYISASLKEAILKRDGGKCQYVDLLTHRKCESRFKIQFDHVNPMAKGGETTLYNLRLLCATHNQLAAIKSLGIEKMNQYLT